MKFRTQYDRVRTSSNKGNPLVTKYRMKVMEDGTHELVADGFYDLYADIQSHKDSTDIKVILGRYERGDFDVLNRRSGMFGDLTAFPKTMAEALQVISDSKSIFDGLDKDVRAQFNNDPNQFIAAFGSEEFFNALGLKPVAESAPVVSAPVEGENQPVGEGKEAK